MAKQNVMVIGDIHIKTKHHERSVALVNDIIETTRIEQPRFVVLLGDVLDGAEVIHSNCLMELNRLLLSVSEVCPVFVLMGNHDASTPHIEMPDNHALHCFKSMQSRGINIIDKPTVIKLTEGGKDLVFMPYLPVGTFSKNLPSSSDQGIGLVFAHQEFVGCVFDGGSESEKGDSINQGFSIISGHIHEEQRIGNLWYTGTPTQTRFGESHDKGYFILELDEESLNYEVVKKIKPKVSKFVSHPFKIGELAEKIKNLHLIESDVNRAVITATPSEILAFKKSSEYAEVLERFKGNIKFNVVKDDSVSKAGNDTNPTTERQSFTETLKTKASEAGLLSLLEESLM
jgi:DNA repair exonuclease SbcCD nuclease subunit